MFGKIIPWHSSLKWDQFSFWHIIITVSNFFKWTHTAQPIPIFKPKKGIITKSKTIFLTYLMMKRGGGGLNWNRVYVLFGLPSIHTIPVVVTLCTWHYRYMYQTTKVTVNNWNGRKLGLDISFLLFFLSVII